MLAAVKSLLWRYTDPSEKKPLLDRDNDDSLLFSAQETKMDTHKPPLSNQTSLVIDALETAHNALASLSLPEMGRKAPLNNLRNIGILLENSMEKAARLKLSPLLEEEHNLISDTSHKCFLQVYTILPEEILAKANNHQAVISIKNNLTISSKLRNSIGVIISASGNEPFQSDITDIKLHKNNNHDISLEFCFSSESVKITMRNNFNILNLTITYNCLFPGCNELTLITNTLSYSTTSSLNIWRISARAISYEWFTLRFGLMTCTSNDGSCITYTGELEQKSIEDLPSGCGQIKVENPDKPIIEFHGAFTNGKMDGNGIMKVVNNGNQIILYAGEWNNGKMTGRGNIYFKESDGPLQATTVVMRNNVLLRELGTRN